MFHAGPQPVHKRLYKGISTKLDKLKRRARHVLHHPHSKAAKYVRNRVHLGKKWVDGKYADDAGRWLRHWFHRRFSWAFIRRHALRIGAACGSVGMSAYLLYRFHDHKPHKKALHRSIEGCVTAAAGAAGAIAIGGG